jgi:hypothetical protein
MIVMTMAFIMKKTIVPSRPTAQMAVHVQQETPLKLQGFVIVVVIVEPMVTAVKTKKTRMLTEQVMLVISVKGIFSVIWM